MIHLQCHHASCFRPGARAPRLPAVSQLQRHETTVLVRDSNPSQQQAAEPAIQLQIPAGDLSIRLMAAEDVQAAALLLTRAFVGTPEAVKLGDAVSFMQKVFENPNKGVTLVARLDPTDKSLLPPKQTTRLVGTVTLSFDPDTREDFATLKPPGTEPYLSNMAVDAKLRRQGIARAMLGACDSAAAGRGHSCVWLHVRASDEAAQSLYTGDGYLEVDRDKQRGFLQFGAAVTQPRILMKKAGLRSS